MAVQERPWWQPAVIYQIYPRSFQDSNGDGVGDLAGITERADYLQWLGVDAVWISPFYPSPMADFGYDVADYTGVDPIFGTLADFDRLVAALHARDIRVILDFVPNHTSDQHPWFRESRASRNSPKRDWYIWRDPAPDGGPPNNWMSLATGGSAWTFDAATGQYYYHAFLDEQPDLNWRNPAVREAMHDALRFWLRPRRRWLSRRRALAPRQGPGVPRQSHQPELSSRRTTRPTAASSRHTTPTRRECMEIVAEMRRVLDEVSGRPAADRRDLPADRRAGGLLWPEI